MSDMFEDDDFVEQTGLIFIGNGYDIYELYEKEDSNGVCFLYGFYEIKNKGYIIGKANNKEDLSTNLSCIAIMRTKGMHRFAGAKVRGMKNWLYLN